MKPENLMIQNGSLKIADFGLAREVRSKPPFTDYVSTRWYRAPEILLRSTSYNSPVDIFALGAIMAELFLLRPLFPGTNEHDQIVKVCSVLGTPSTQDWPEGYRLASRIGLNFPMVGSLDLQKLIPKAPPEAIDLMLRMMRFDSQRRPTASECLEHQYFSNLKSMIPMNINYSYKEPTNKQNFGSNLDRYSNDIIPDLMTKKPKEIKLPAYSKFSNIPTVKPYAESNAQDEFSSNINNYKKPLYPTYGAYDNKPLIPRAPERRLPKLNLLREAPSYEYQQTNLKVSPQKNQGYPLYNKFGDLAFSQEPAFKPPPYHNPGLFGPMKQYQRQYQPAHYSLPPQRRRPYNNENDFY